MPETPEKKDDSVVSNSGRVTYKPPQPATPQTDDTAAYMQGKRRIIISAAGCGISLVLFLAGLFSIGFEAPIPELLKVILFFGGGAGLITCIVLTIRFTISFIRYRKNGTPMPATVIPAAVRSFINQNVKPDVIRVPVAYDDNAAQEILARFTEKFLEDVVLPAELEEFLYDDERRVFIHYYEGGYDVDYIEMDAKYEADKIKEINTDLIVNTNDYFTQFRRVLFFADDETGHRHFLLNYRFGNTPNVMLLDDETDEVELLANSFEEFLQNMVTPRQAHDLLGNEYYGYYEDE